MAKHLSSNESYPPLQIVSPGQTTSLKTIFTCESPPLVRDTVVGWFILPTSIFKGQTHPSIEGARTSFFLSLSFSLSLSHSSFLSFSLKQANQYNFQQQDGELV